MHHHMMYSVDNGLARIEREMNSMSSTEFEMRSTTQREWYMNAFSRLIDKSDPSDVQAFTAFFLADIHLQLEWLG
jgi:hypothetical protein